MPAFSTALSNGSPITTSGTIAIGLQSGYSIPTTANQSSWSAKQDALPSGTYGQFLQIDGSGDKVFRGLDITPSVLSFGKISVGDANHYASELPNFEFLEKRYISISRIGDNASKLNLGMTL